MRRFGIVLFFSFIFLDLAAQVDTTSRKSTLEPLISTNPELNFEGTGIILGKDTVDSDSIPTIPPQTTSDSLQLTQDTVKQDSTIATQKNDIETTINYNARDSMIFDIQNQKLFLYGESHIDYGTMQLEADEVSIEWDKRTIKAQYTLDSLGRKRGKPVFSQGSEVYETEDITYNFTTERAIIKGVITEQDGAFMHGEDVKKNEDNEMFIRGAKYTTCNLSDPHFFIESTKLKVIPGNKIVSGPFNMKFREVPTPLWFPFGMFPEPREKSSGIVFPSYGEENRRGFFLRDGGYYFSFSDYVDLRLTGDIYSKGGHAVNAVTNYKVRYKFNGSFNLSYNKNISDDIENPLETNDYWIRWSHRPETRGNSSLSASVSAGTSTYNNNNNLAISPDPAAFQRSINSQFASSVSYTQKLGSLFNMATNFRHNQNVQTGIYTMTLPDFSINMQRIYPFKDLVKSSKSPLAKVSFSHNFVAKNEFTNAPLRSSGLPFTPVNAGEGLQDTLEFSLDNLDEVYKRAKIGGRHSIPISTSFNLLKHFTMSPSFNYEEVWYTRELDFNGGYNPELGGVKVDTIEGFSRAGSWRSGASMNTRMYGMYYFKGIDAIEAIRHVITPSVSFSYNPDFGDEKYGVWETIEVDSTGREQRVSKYQGFAYGQPSGRESKTLGFSLTNNIEMKVRTKNDTAQEFKKIKLFDNLSFNSGYNFALDSFNVSNVSWNARTSFLQNKISLTLSGQVDPYLYVENGTSRGQRINRFAWNNGQGFGTLTNLSTAISLNLSPKKSTSNTNSQDGQQARQGALSGGINDALGDSQYGTEEEREWVMANPEEYVDFNLPWTLRVSYSINRRKNGLEDPEITAHTVSLNGSVGLTQKTQITYNTSYDIKNKSFATTRIGVSRDLHCWSLNFDWVPFGRYQSFSLTIRPKSALLQDLKLEKRRNFFDFFQ